MSQYTYCDTVCLSHNTDHDMVAHEGCSNAKGVQSSLQSSYTVLSDVGCALCVVLVTPNNTTVALLTLNTATIGRCIRTRCISLQTPSAHTHTMHCKGKNVNASLHYFQERQRVENLCQNSLKSKLVYCFLVDDGGKLGHIRWIIWISPPCSIP